MPRDYNFWIYVVTNRNQSVPYIGVTNSLSRELGNTARERGVGSHLTIGAKS